MAEKAKEVIRWLRTLPEDATVFIDEGGTCLHDYNSVAYYEVGGETEEESDDIGIRGVDHPIPVHGVNHPRPPGADGRIIGRRNGKWALLEPFEDNYRVLLYMRSDESFLEFEKRCADYDKPKKEGK